MKAAPARIPSPSATRKGHKKAAAVQGRPRVDLKNLEAALGAGSILVSGPGEVRRYLRRYPDLAKVVVPVCLQARKEFGPRAELVMHLYRDPEIKDQHLTLTVRLPSYNGRILDRMASVTEKFDRQLSAASGYLLLTTDLNPPRGKHGV
jgi:hypothetical protein